MAKWLKCDAVAELLSVKVTTIWDWIKTGKLKAYKIGKSYRIDEADVERMMKSAED